MGGVHDYPKLQTFVIMHFNGEGAHSFDQIPNGVCDTTKFNLRCYSKSYSCICLSVLLNNHFDWAWVFHCTSKRDHLVLLVLYPFSAMVKAWKKIIGKGKDKLIEKSSWYNAGAAS